MAMIDGMLQELDTEAQTTRRLLERVPDHKLEWRPHAKARTLGQLAMHVATVPGSVAELAATPSPAQVPQFRDPDLKSAAELLPALEQSTAKARNVLGRMDDASLTATWRLMHGEREADAGLDRATRLPGWTKSPTGWTRATTRSWRR